MQIAPPWRVTWLPIFQRVHSPAFTEPDPLRKDELLQMADILTRVPWEPARTFWKRSKSLWITHMLVMADRKLSPAGRSFWPARPVPLSPLGKALSGRVWILNSGKELLKCFWIHCR